MVIAVCLILFAFFVSLFGTETQGAINLCYDVDYSVASQTHEEAGDTYSTEDISETEGSVDPAVNELLENTVVYAKESAADELTSLKNAGKKYDPNKKADDLYNKYSGRS